LLNDEVGGETGGSVANSPTSEEAAKCELYSGGQNGKLFGQRRVWIVAEPCLAFAHHVNHFDSCQDDVGACGCFETKHRSGSALDPAAVLFNPVVQIFALPDLNGFFELRSFILSPMLGVARNHGLVVGLTAVNDNTIRAAMPIQGLAEEPLCCR
jgi:hypothetical protein